VNALKTITIITPSNIEVEYRLANVGSRLGAAIIDYALQFLAVLLAALIIFNFGRQMDMWEFNVNYSIVWAVVILIIFMIFMGYFIVCELLMNGQTIGKRILGLRVIRDNGQPIEFSHALIRGIIRSSLDMMYVGFFAILFSKKHKRIGDMAAGTIVIIEKYADNFAALTIQDYSLPDTFPPMEEMTATERDMVETWLRRRDTLPGKGRVIGKMIEDYFNDKLEVI